MTTPRHRFSHHVVQRARAWRLCWAADFL